MRHSAINGSSTKGSTQAGRRGRTTSSPPCLATCPAEEAAVTSKGYRFVAPSHGRPFRGPASIDAVCPSPGCRVRWTGVTWKRSASAGSVAAMLTSVGAFPRFASLSCARPAINLLRRHLGSKFVERIDGQCPACLGALLWVCLR